MEYAAGSSRKDPGQGHINLLPSDVVITEAPMRQFDYSLLYFKYCAFTFKELIGTIDA